MTSSIEIRRLITCSFDAALEAWNQGFQGYFVDMTLSLDSFLARLNSEGLSPEYSLMAFCEDKPVGLLLNGLRVIDGRKIAWNGGTGVAPDFRRRGVGKALMQTTLELYREQSVDLAKLEAIVGNEKAISLYAQFGYQIHDRLVFLQHDGPLPRRFSQQSNDSYSIRSVAPYAVGQLSFYQNSVPWQAQWQSVNLKGGEALLVADARGAEAGYALYKRKYGETGKLNSIVLYQCSADPERADARAIVECALDHLFGPPELEYRRSTCNLSKSNELVTTTLGEMGFTTFIEQVEMVLRLDG